MRKKSILLTESEMEQLIEDVVKELINETGGYSLGIGALHHNVATNVVDAGVKDINLTNGKAANAISHKKRAKDTYTTQKGQFLNMYANEPFRFNTQMRGGLRHSIDYLVTDIEYVSDQIVKIYGLWTDYDLDDTSGTTKTIKKRVKVNVQTGVPTFYNPVSRSNNAVLNTRTKTSAQWDAFVAQLQRFVTILTSKGLERLN